MKVEIVIYIVVAIIIIIGYVGIKFYSERMLQHRDDEQARVKKVSRIPHPYEDNNKQYRKQQQSTTFLWKVTTKDKDIEKRMLESIQKKLKGEWL